MSKTKKLKLPSSAPLGIPGAGPGWHRSASQRGSGRLGSVLKQSRKSANNTPKKSENEKTRALAARETKVQKVDAAPQSKPSKKPVEMRNVSAGGESQPKEQKRNEMTTGPAPSIRSPVGSDQQKRARTAAKFARKKEAGLEGRRTGKASGSGRRVQGRRDSKQ